MSRRVIVIGGGLSGLTAALSAARAGATVSVIVGGQGAHHLFSGCIDVLGYLPELSTAIDSPLKEIAELSKTLPEHPYAKIGAACVREGLAKFKNDLMTGGLNYLGDGSIQQHIVTALGTIRQTGLIPGTMNQSPDTIEVACNINSFHHFSAELFANELTRRTKKKILPLQFLHHANRQDVFGIAQSFRQPEFIDAFGQFLRERAADSVVAIPAVLGVDDADQVKAQVEAIFGGRLCETPAQPPSLPGLRLFNALRRLVLDAGVRLMHGTRAIEQLIENGRLAGMQLKIGHIIREEYTDAVILAAGHLISGGILGDRHGLREPVFGLPLTGSITPPYFHAEFLTPAGHPALAAGVAVDAQLRPLVDGAPRFENLYACGDILGGFNPYQERSGGGVAVVTGQAAGRWAAGANV